MSKNDQTQVPDSTSRTFSDDIKDSSIQTRKRRWRTEKEALTIKREALEVYINSPTFQTLDSEEQNLLTAQAQAMVMHLTAIEDLVNYYQYAAAATDDQG